MLNKVPVFHFQNLSDLIDCNSLFGYNQIFNCKSKCYEILSFETKAEFDAMRK